MGLERGGGLFNRWVKEVTVKTPPVPLSRGLFSPPLSGEAMEVSGEERVTWALEPGPSKACLLSASVFLLLHGSNFVCFNVDNIL